MKIMRDLAVFCDRDLVDAVVSRIEAETGGDWHRSREAEAGMGSCVSGDPMYTFARRSIDNLPAVGVVMSFHRGALRVVNIVPRRGELSTHLYNSVLTEFHLRLVYPAASALRLRTELSRDELSLEEVFGWKGSQLLKGFSLLANKSALHPFDERRWFRLLICLHQRPRHPYEEPFLRRFLLDDGWSRERADELVAQLRFARDLLQLCDSENANAVFAS